MIKTLQLLLFLLLPLAIFGQTDSQARLPIVGGVSELGVSPSEQIWVATKAGNTYFTRQIGELWHFGPFGSKDEYALSNSGLFERVSFFSEDTLMISGFIHGDEGNQDFIFRSVDQGKTWDKVKFGASSWIDAAYVNEKGKAWMSGNSQLIYHTSDSGKTWKAFRKVEPTGNLRFSTIHFSKDEKTGLFGSFYNVIYRTTDNCSSWEKLPTPLSQHKYKRMSRHDRPDIRKIRMFGGQYIVNQQGRVFISKADTIDWKPLKDVVDFEVTQNENLYVVKGNLSVALYDSGFTSIWKSEKRFKGYPVAIATQNENLFALTNETVYKVNPQSFVASDMMTDEVPISEPYLKVKHKGEQYGFSHRDVLRFDRKNKQWYRILTLDFPIGNATVFQNRLLVSDASLKQHYSLCEDQKAVEKYDLPASLFDVSANKIVAFHIETGSQGCFHSDNSRRTYKRKGDKFTLDKKASTAGYLNGMSTELNSGTLNQLVDVLDASRNKLVMVSDLQLSGKDIAAFKNFIDKEEKRISKSGIDRFNFNNLYSFPGEHADFAFYKSVADSLYALPDADVSSAFWQDYGNLSTTVEWKRFIFEFQDNTKLIIENASDKPNYLHVPWLVDYEGLKFKSNSVHYGRMLDELTKGDFLNKYAAEKNYAIFKIVDFLYRKKLNVE